MRYNGVRPIPPEPLAGQEIRYMQNARSSAARSRVAFVLICAPALLAAQDRLKSMPGYEQYQRMAPLIRTALPGSQGFGRGGGAGVSWSADGRSFEYESGGKRYHYDLANGQISDVQAATQQPT